ncbi:cytosolic protein [candidate division KSB1 bacterium]|nr:cytosolic protein [candidate division KSB1 bacterium]
MENLKKQDIVQYVEQNIGFFHQKRIESLKKLELKEVLKRKNPYLFKAKYLLTAQDIIKGLTDAFISSNEETIFGDWLEGLAIFSNQKVYQGWKSGIKGIDLEFDKDSIRYIVAIKSGPNWGNSSQIAKMKTDFISAKKSLRTSNSKILVRAVNGCCYGKCFITDKGEYFKFCGQKFWEFISGDSNLYQTIIEPLGYKAKEKNEVFQESYSKMINKFTREFMQDFCSMNGEINWEKLVKFNSGIGK